MCRCHPLACAVWQRIKDATYQIVLFLGLGIIAGVVFLAILLAGERSSGS